MQSQPLPISVCLIAGNEAARIHRALASVTGWTRETIVVINDDVNDGTDRIAESFGARVFREPWKGHKTQKNSAADKAGQEWILGLDADEEVSPALREEIQQLFQTPASTQPFAAFSFPRCTLYGGRWIRHGDWYPDRKSRLWRRNQARWEGGELHESLVAQGKTGRLKSDLLHYSMEDLNHHLRKTAKYSDFFARERSGLRVGVAEIWFRPWWRFFRGYFLRLGFLDGWQGYAVARMASLETFLRYAKIREAQLPPRQDQISH